MNLLPVNININKTLLRILSFIAFITLTKAQTKGSVSRIVGGYDAPDDYGKFHVSLQNLAGSHVCGGTIVSAHYIVTAAHCVYGTEPKYVKVVTGTTNLDVGGLQYNVTNFFIHEKFDYQLKTNDIAILKILGFFDIRFVKFLELYSDDLNENDSVIISGFGSLQAHGETGPQMSALNVTVFCQETCKYAMRYTREVYDEMFCTFTLIGEGTCHGDSGGPLIKDNKLVGVVSWGIPCAIGFPDVHTRIAPYIEWIQEIILRKPNVCT